MGIWKSRGGQRLLCGALLLGAASLISFRSTYEPDLWWHLAQGRELASGHLVRSNIFSFTYPDYPQQYTSWLFDAGSYLLWTRGGAVAIQAVQALVIAAALGFVAAACRLRASTPASVTAIAFGWLVLEPRAMPRPYIASFLGLAVCVYLIERSRSRHSWRPLLWTPLAIAVWSNLHAESVIGVIAVALYGGAEWLLPRDLSRRDATRVLLVAAAALAATMATPYGTGLLRYMYDNSFVPQVIRIAELQPVYLPNYRGFFAWSFIVVATVALGRLQVRLFDLIVIVIFGALGCRYLRLTPLLFLMTGPLVARGVDRLRTLGANPRAIAGAAVLIAVVMVRVPGQMGAWHAGGDALEPATLFSPAAMQFARDRGLEGPAFTSINLGGYVAWHLYPAARISLDTRLQAYPPAYFHAVAEASADPAAWTTVTNGVDWAVLSRPRVNEWSGVGRFDPAAWGVAYRDPAIEILVRRRGRFGALAE